MFSWLVVQDCGVQGSRSHLLISWCPQRTSLDRGGIQEETTICQAFDLRPRDSRFQGAGFRVQGQGRRVQGVDYEVQVYGVKCGVQGAIGSVAEHRV